MTNNIAINWNEDEFKAYTLIFSMKANTKKKDEKTKIINEIVGSNVFKRAYKEFKNDTFCQRIQKISDTAKNLNYSKNDIQSLFYDIKRIFDTDGEFSLRERNLTLSLKRAFDF